jgi:hypothetical protein
MALNGIICISFKRCSPKLVVRMPTVNKGEIFQELIHKNQYKKSNGVIYGSFACKFIVKFWNCFSIMRTQMFQFGLNTEGVKRVKKVFISFLSLPQKFSLMQSAMLDPRSHKNFTPHCRIDLVAIYISCRVPHIDFGFLLLLSSSSIINCILISGRVE